MRSDAFDQQRELRMKARGRGSGGEMARRRGEGFEARVGHASVSGNKRGDEDDG